MVHVLGASKEIILLLILSLVLVSFPEIGVVKAEPRTIVVPDDYSSIQEAISVTDDGDTIFVKKGIYEGPLNETLIFNKSISLIGEETNTTILNLHPLLINTTLFYQPYQTYSTSISVESNNVTISGFTVNTPAPGGGISVTGDGTQITDCNMNPESLTLTGSYSTISETILKGTLRVNGSNQTIIQSTIKGIDITSSHNNITGNCISSKMEVKGSYNTISGNNITETQGMIVSGNSNIISNNHVRNGVKGISLASGSNNVIYENKVTGNWFMGMHLYEASNNLIFDNYIANNIDDLWEKNGFGISIGGTHYRAENNTFYRNTLINNSYNFRILEPYYINYWDNGSEGNYWDDYTGSDNDGDGIGDTPYILNENNQDNYPIMNHSTIPEFLSWIILPLFLTATLVIVIFRKRLKKGVKSGNYL